MSASGNPLAAACVRMEYQIAEMKEELAVVRRHWHREEKNANRLSVALEHEEAKTSALKARLRKELQRSNDCIAELEAEVQHQTERREEEKLRAVNAEAERDAP